MIRTMRRCEELLRQLPATLAAVEEFCRPMREWVDSFAPRHAFAVELLVREALNNAVLHGCECDPSRQVQCRLRIRRGRLTIAVKDDGCGFDWRTATQQETDLDACSGRGMLIYQSYADRIRFGRRGNSVVLMKVIE